MLTTAVIVTGVVGAPIARADNGADLAVPSQAGVAAAVADAAVPASTGSESAMAAVAPVAESLLQVAQAAEAALQPVSPSPGTEPVVPSQAEQPPSAGVAASPAPPPASPTEPRTEALPQPDNAISGAQVGDSGVAPDPRSATPADKSSSDITAAQATTSEQSEAPSPTAASQLGPVNIQISIRVASPGDNGAITQVNAVLTAAAGTAAPLLKDHTEHVDTPASPGESDDIGGDITGVADGGFSHDSIQDPTCHSNEGCCGISLLAGICLDTDGGVFSPQDITRLLDAILENASDNSDVTAQYQGSAVQYRPTNISVSIRISSPGNDGTVVQTNLVHVQASIAVEVSQADQPLPGPIELAPGDGEVAQQEPVDGESESVADAFASSDIEVHPTSIPAPTPLDRPFPLSSDPVSRRLNAISRLAWGVGRPSSVAWSTPVGSPGASRDVTARATADRTAHRQSSRATAPTPPPAHPWLPVTFSVAPAPASSGGGGGGGGLAMALSLPFVLALLYTGFGRLRASVSVPSAHIDREPERPG